VFACKVPAKYPEVSGHKDAKGVGLDGKLDIDGQIRNVVLNGSWSLSCGLQMEGLKKGATRAP
jgi:hypothetical protein